jgi:hypothetical protein
MLIRQYSAQVVVVTASLCSVVATALPRPATTTFVGGEGNCISEKTVFCATGGGLGASCDKTKVECGDMYRTGWNNCDNGEGNESTDCKSDADCTSDKNAKRSGTCTGE